MKKALSVILVILLCSFLSMSIFAAEGDLIKDVKATVGSNYNNYPVEKVINGDGLTHIGIDATHHNNASGDEMWMTNNELNENAWIKFNLGAQYKLGNMYVWNYNQDHPDYPGLSGRGMKDVIIEYSLDGEKWTELKGQGYPYQFAKAEGLAEQPATNLNDGKNSPVDFGGAMAQFVRITAKPGSGNGNWGGFTGTELYTGLSEVIFTEYIPGANEGTQSTTTQSLDENTQTATKKNPKTGDSMAVWPVMLAAVAGLLVIACRSKKMIYNKG